MPELRRERGLHLRKEPYADDGRQLVPSSGASPRKAGLAEMLSCSHFHLPVSRPRI